MGVNRLAAIAFYLGLEVFGGLAYALGQSLFQPPQRFYYSRIMETKTAIATLSALGQDARLNIFRLLIKAGPEGLAAGRIAERLGVPSATLSANLNILNHAGLVTARREGRFIIYSARFEQLRDLIGFLIQDCCDGAPELCAPLADLLEEAECHGC